MVFCKDFDLCVSDVSPVANKGQVMQTGGSTCMWGLEGEHLWSERGHLCLHMRNRILFKPNSFIVFLNYICTTDGRGIQFVVV